MRTIQTNAFFIRSEGIRDDLTFLLEEELSQINLCSLHCELRNTEQLLRSLGFLAYKIGSLEELNAVLACYGPESQRTASRLTVEENQGQQTAITRSNIKLKSFTGKLIGQTILCVCVLVCVSIVLTTN